MRHRYVSFALLILFAAAALETSTQETPPESLSEAGYAGIIADQGRQSDAERWERVLSLYLAEGEESITREVEGSKAILLRRGEAGIGADRRRAAARLDAVRSIEPDSLSPAARLDWQVLRSVASSEAEIAQFPTGYASPDWPDMELWWYIDVLPRKTLDDYQEILAWLRGVPIGVSESQELLQRGLTRGVGASRRDVTAAIERLRELVAVNDPLASRYLAAFKEYPPSVGSEAQKAVTEEAIGLFRERIRPAYTKYIAYLEHTYLPAARVSDAMGTLPDGHAWYAALVRRATGLSISAEHVHQNGLAEVRRLERELAVLVASHGFDGSFEQFVTKVRSDPRCSPLDAAAVTAQFARITEAVERHLPRLFGTIPKTPYEVKPVASLPPGAAGGQA